jgi:POT family proton-dependent oligopeptide transporter
MVVTGLAVIIVGTGLLKPNTTSMVGDLYSEDDPRRDSGFSVYYMAINLGAFLSPLVCGYLAQTYSWQAGFAAAAVGMTAGLIHYVIDWRGLGDLGARPKNPLTPDERRAMRMPAALGVVVLVALAVVGFVLRPSLAAVEQALTAVVVVLPIAYFLWLIKPGDRPRVERRRLTALFVLFLATAAWYAVVAQAGSTLNVFAEMDTQRDLFGFSVPAAWFQSINPICILLFAPVLAWLWVRLGDRQPSTPAKFAMALLLVATSMALMMVAGQYTPVEGRATVLVSPLWLVVVYVVQTIGELLISPIGLSVATRLAPANATSQIMGVWFLSFAIGAALSGELANLYGLVGVQAYYGLLGLLMLATAAALVLLRGPLLQWMEGVR